MKQSKNERWQRVLRAYEQIGKSQQDFCTSEHLTFSTFQYWKQQLSRATEGLKYVQVATMPIPQRDITISYESGIRIIIPEAIARDTLSRVILAVTEAICETTGTAQLESPNLFAVREMGKDNRRQCK